LCGLKKKIFPLKSTELRFSSKQAQKQNLFLPKKKKLCSVGSFCMPKLEIFLIWDFPT